MPLLPAIGASLRTHTRIDSGSNADRPPRRRALRSKCSNGRARRWLTAAHPDPAGTRLLALRSFFRRLAARGELPPNAGLFWDVRHCAGPPPAIEPALQPQSRRPSSLHPPSLNNLTPEARRVTSAHRYLCTAPFTTRVSSCPTLTSPCSHAAARVAVGELAAEAAHPGGGRHLQQRAQDHGRLVRRRALTATSCVLSSRPHHHLVCPVVAPSPPPRLRPCLHRLVCVRASTTSCPSVPPPRLHCGHARYASPLGTCVLQNREVAPPAQCDLSFFNSRPCTRAEYGPRSPFVRRRGALNSKRASLRSRCLLTRVYACVLAGTGRRRPERVVVQRA
jgi:hypothetical protein